MRTRVPLFKIHFCGDS